MYLGPELVHNPLLVVGNARSSTGQGTAFNGALCLHSLPIERSFTMSLPVGSGLLWRSVILLRDALGTRPGGTFHDLALTPVRSAQRQHPPDQTT